MGWGCSFRYDVFNMRLIAFCGLHFAVFPWWNTTDEKDVIISLWAESLSIIIFPCGNAEKKFSNYHLLRLRYLRKLRTIAFSVDMTSNYHFFGWYNFELSPFQLIWLRIITFLVGYDCKLIANCFKLSYSRVRCKRRCAWEECWELLREEPERYYDTDFPIRNTDFDCGADCHPALTQKLHVCPIIGRVLSIYGDWRKLCCPLGRVFPNIHANLM